MISWIGCLNISPKHPFVSTCFHVMPRSSKFLRLWYIHTENFLHATAINGFRHHKRHTLVPEQLLYWFESLSEKFPKKPVLNAFPFPAPTAGHFLVPSFCWQKLPEYEYVKALTKTNTKFSKRIMIQCWIYFLLNKNSLIKTYFVFYFFIFYLTVINLVLNKNWTQHY